VVDGTRDTPLHMAVRAGLDEVAAYLSRAPGANLGLRNAAGLTSAEVAQTPVLLGGGAAGGDEDMAASVCLCVKSLRSRVLGPGGPMCKHWPVCLCGLVLPGGVSAARGGEPACISFAAPWCASVAFLTGG
jgi:hypothetical protein